MLRLHWLFSFTFCLLMALPQHVCCCDAHEQEGDDECCVCQSPDRDAVPPPKSTDGPRDAIAGVFEWCFAFTLDEFTSSQSFIAEPDPGPPRIYLHICQFRN